MYITYLLMSHTIFIPVEKNAVTDRFYDGKSRGGDDGMTEWWW